MNKVKFTYEQPSCENLVVRFDGAVCVSGPNSVRANSASSGYYGDGYDLGDLDD